MWAMIIAHESVCDRITNYPLVPAIKTVSKHAPRSRMLKQRPQSRQYLFDVSDHNAVSFDAIYHSAVIRAERHEHYLKQNRDWL